MNAMNGTEDDEIFDTNDEEEEENDDPFSGLSIPESVSSFEGVIQLEDSEEESHLKSMEDPEIMDTYETG